MPPKRTLAQQLSGVRLGPGVGEALNSLSPPLDPVWSDFSGGYQNIDSLEDSRPNASSSGTDMEVDKRDRLIRAPGVSLLEEWDYTPVSAIVQPATNETSELLLFAPPFVGVKFYGDTVWTNEGLEPGSYVTSTLYGDVAVFSDRIRLYMRSPKSAVKVIQDGPPGSAVGVFGARVLVGGTLINGNIEPQGIKWSGAEGDHTDWTGLGSGQEFLVTGAMSSDRIVSMRPVNLDLLAILNRHSLWAATLTGNGLVPFRFTLRVVNVGCVADKTAQVTDAGVIFLSDDGVRGFDGNTSVMLSEQINSELLPLIGNGAGYSSSYDPLLRRYYLFVPSGPTYVLDLAKGRWYKWSRTFTLGIGFPVQYSQETWASIIGTWATETRRWTDLVTREGSARHLLIAGDQLGLEDRSVETSLGATFYPTWTMPLTHGDSIEQMFRTDLVEVRHEGAGVVRVNLPDNDGNYTAGKDLMLTGSSPQTTKQNPNVTHLGMGLQLQIRSGSPAISRIHLNGRFQGRRQK